MPGIRYGTSKVMGKYKGSRSGRKKKPKVEKPPDPLGRGGRRPGAGRPKGTFKVLERQEELSKLCRQSAPEVFQELLKMAMYCKEPQIKLSAIREIFDRGFGRPKQITVLEGDMRITHEQALREINARLEQPVDLERDMPASEAIAIEQVEQIAQANADADNEERDEEDGRIDKEAAE